jgi:hypothetical protein
MIPSGPRIVLVPAHSCIYLAIQDYRLQRVLSDTSEGNDGYPIRDNYLWPAQ